MNKNTKMAMNLLAVAVGMLMLAYASVPLYRLFCAVTGYGGTTQRGGELPKEISQRTIKIEFNADIDSGLNWDFAAGEQAKTVHIGEQSLTHYVAHNRENHAVTGRSIYNVLPFKAGKYFHKIQCFCFDEQTLAAGQKVNMPVSFFIDPAMLNDPEMQNVKIITLSYTFFPVKK